jgi:hypothetical protein
VVQKEDQKGGGLGFVGHNPEGVVAAARRVCEGEAIGKGGAGPDAPRNTLS